MRRPQPKLLPDPAQGGVETIAGGADNHCVMRVLLALAVLAVVSTTISSSRASEEWSFEAFQPIWTENSIALSRVTVVTLNSGESGVYAVLATTDSSQVMTDFGPQQRNAAFEVGLRAEVTFNSAKDPPLFGDTLRVVLHETKPPVDLEDFSYTTVLAATIQCVLANAAQTHAIKFVALRVDSERFRKYGGVFSTTSFRSGPRKRDFSD